MDWYQELKQYPRSYTIRKSQIMEDPDRALEVAIENDRLDVLKYLVEELSIDIHQAPLLYLVMTSTLSAENADILEYLLKDCKIDISDPAIAYIVNRSVVNSKNHELTQLCMDHNLNLHAAGYLVIKGAASHGFIDLFKKMHADIEPSKTVQAVLETLRYNYTSIESVREVVRFYASHNVGVAHYFFADLIKKMDIQLLTQAQAKIFKNGAVSEEDSPFLREFFNSDSAMRAYLFDFGTIRESVLHTRDDDASISTLKPTRI